MMVHQPFPIADFVEGLRLDKEPWLSPRNAFRRLEDGRVFRGRLQKRRGFSRFAETGVAASQVTSLYGISNRKIYEPVPADAFFVPESIRMTYEDASAATLDAEVRKNTMQWSGYVWEWPVYETGTDTILGYAYPWTDVPFVGVDWSLHSGFTGYGPNQGFMDYAINPRNPITGLTSYRSSTSEFLVCMDTDSLYLYDVADGYFKAEATAGVFNGSGTDYFWTWPVDSYLLMTNGVDPVYKWTPGAGTPLVEMPTPLSTGGGNVIDTAKVVIQLKSRLIYLNTTESGNRFPGRARYTVPSVLEELDPFYIADAPASLGEIRTAGIIGESLFVGFDKGWMILEETGDPAAPLIWRPAVSRFGVTAKLSVIPDGERLLTRSNSSIQAIDPNGQYAADPQIPDFVLDFNPDKADLTAGLRNEGNRAFWWTYANTAEDLPSNILVAQYDEESRLAWSTYRMPFNVFGSYDNESTPTWDSLPGTWDDYAGVSWDSAQIVAGYSRILGGSSDGFVHTFDLSTSDFNRQNTGDAIVFEAETQALSPYGMQKAHLGWVDVYGSAVVGASLEMRFYFNSNSAAFKTATIDFSPDDASGKVYRRVTVNRSATFHRIEIRGSGTSHFEIDAIVPWFRPAGRVRRFG